MNKKKMKICLVLILVLIECISLTLTIKSFSNRNLDEIKEEHKVNNKKFSMYIKNDEGVYEPYENNNLFPEGYNLNLNKSSCVDTNGNTLNGTLTTSGTNITITSNKTTYCYLYFDLMKDLEIEISTDGESGIIPISGTYTNSATCSNGNITWSDRYQRIEIGDLTRQTKCNLTFTKDTSTKTLLRTEVEAKATSQNNGYRYVGKNPNNYIWFNNEMWRIIGSIPVCLSTNCGTNTTNLVKIIREESIGNIRYSSNSSTTWGNNTLYTLLNNYYYGGKDGTGTDYCSSFNKISCDYTKIGIKPNNYYGKMVKNVYWNTGGTLHGNTVSDAYSGEILTRNVSGYIGIITVSDYGYAPGGYSSTSLSSYGGYPSSSNWLYNGEISMTSTYSTAVSNRINCFDYNGNLTSDTAALFASIKPVLYLDSNVFIISGTGTEKDPYVIGM